MQHPTPRNQRGLVLGLQCPSLQNGFHFPYDKCFLNMEWYNYFLINIPFVFLDAIVSTHFLPLTLMITTNERSKLVTVTIAIAKNKKAFRMLNSVPVI